MDLKNKVILISGASSGMGREIVRILSNEECKLALFSRREKKLEEISKLLSIKPIGSKKETRIFILCSNGFKKLKKCSKSTWFNSKAELLLLPCD